MNDSPQTGGLGSMNQSFRILHRALVAEPAMGKPYPIGVVKDARASHRFRQLFCVGEIKWENLNSPKQRRLGLGMIGQRSNLLAAEQ
jgi:hypothetical protein